MFFELNLHFIKKNTEYIFTMLHQGNTTQKGHLYAMTMSYGLCFKFDMLED